MKNTNILVAVALAVIIAVIGYTAATTNSYVDIDEVAKYSKVKTVNVKGRVVDIEIDQKHDEVVFLLEGNNGVRIPAYYRLSDFVKNYGGLPSHRTVSEQIVVRGVYHPDPSTGYPGYIVISQILQGCHKAYEAPPVNS